MTAILQIPTSKIRPGNNDRKLFDRAALQELADSIEQHGLAQPITVRPLLDENAYEVVCGERRFRAISQILRWDSAPCIVRNLSDEEASGIMLVENCARADLNPIEESNAYRERINRFGWNVDHLAKIAGVSPQLVSRRLSLLELNSHIQELVAKRHMPIGHAEAMTPLDHDRQMIAFRLFRDSKGMTLATMHRIVSDLLAEQSQDSLFDLETFWQETISHADSMVLRGKNAIVPVPTRKDIPQPETRVTDTASAVILRYVNSLLEAGHTEEAGAIGTLYQALVHNNWLSLPLALSVAEGLPN